MKAKGIFISTLLVIDTFFVSYAAGFHSKHVLVINPKLPPVVQKKVEAKPTVVAAPAKKDAAKETHPQKNHAAKASDNKKAGAKPATKSASKPKATTKPAASSKPAKSTPSKVNPKPANHSPGA